jgi:hypothetical protein
VGGFVADGASGETLGFEVHFEGDSSLTPKYRGRKLISLDD